MVLGQLADKAKMVTETFNSIPGLSCNTVQGAMYAFPQIKLPPKAIQAAKVRHCFVLFRSKQGQDLFFSKRVLSEEIKVNISNEVCFVLILYRKCKLDR